MAPGACGSCEARASASSREQHGLSHWVGRRVTPGAAGLCEGGASLGPSSRTDAAEALSVPSGARCGLKPPTAPWLSGSTCRTGTSYTSRAATTSKGSPTRWRTSSSAVGPGSRAGPQATRERMLGAGYGKPAWLGEGREAGRAEEDKTSGPTVRPAARRPCPQTPVRPAGAPPGANSSRLTRLDASGPVSLARAHRGVRGTRSRPTPSLRSASAAQWRLALPPPTERQAERWRADHSRGTR
jgi:hypothetical protein